MKIRPFLTLDEQIHHLETNKNIQFDNKEEASEFLKNNNYFNFISCSKVKFVIGIEDQKHVYPATNFSDWVAYFQTDGRVSEYLMANIIQIERRVNSRLSCCISEMLDENFISEHHKNEIEQIIKSARKNSKYKGNNTWRFIAQMTFGEMKKLLMWLHDNKVETYKDITSGFGWLQTSSRNENVDRLHELNHLRNDLFHCRPLNVYLTYGKGEKQIKQHKTRKTVTDSVLNYRSNAIIRQSLETFHVAVEDFIEIKNSQAQA